MSILEYNGSAIVAMKGKNCVGIASDRRFGIQHTTLSCNQKKIFTVHDKLMIGYSGLVTDMLTLQERFQFRLNMYRMREEREIKPSAFTALVSSILYEKRFSPYFVEPVIAGLEGPNNTPFISATDLIGAPVFADDFAVAGTNIESLYGACESFYKPDMDPEQLFETLAQTLMNGMDRDALAGWGGIVHIITPEGTTTKTLKTRMD
eukprot:c17305_g2_i5.p1 GENE.c17305_g2_i5~~c17305_g2_i5.p1  ORF type:complete len:206 (-),score=84.66 c17305_g2_i5:23-640(-)